MRCLIYALGSGWGHLNRALSLGRVIAKKGKVIIITSSPYSHLVNTEGCYLKRIPQHQNFQETYQLVRDIIIQDFQTSSEYKCLIVDTFPRGLGGELADILPTIQNIPKILIHRDINPRYVAAKNLRNFVTKHYDGIIIPGEGNNLPLSDLSKVKHTHPWLIRHYWELESIIATPKNILKVDASVTTILVCAGGKLSELSFFSELTQKLHQVFPECAVRILAATLPIGCCSSLWISHHPGIECIAAADIVIGGGGYNTVYECAAVNVPLIAIAFERVYDLQNERAAKNPQNYIVNHIPSVISPEDISRAIAQVKVLLKQIETKKNHSPNLKKSIPHYKNGALEAFNHIQKQFLV
ncbi:MAG: glycosyltransferase [Cyanobacteria bacterium P01_A01_bin.84]